MSIVNYSTAFKALDRYVTNYNTNQEHLSSHIRQAMILTTREIIKIYALSLLKSHRIAPIDVKNLPPLRTNNIQLAKKAGASSRTIQRHLKRLLQAKIIVKKIWHGSNSGYELFINPDILLISCGKPVEKPKNEASVSKSENAQNQSIKNRIAPSCPHTDTSNNSYINNILIAVDKSKNVNEKEIAFDAQGQTRKTSESFSTGYTGKKSPQTNDGTGEKVRIKRVTMQTRRENSSLTAARSASLSLYVNALWKLARKTIYKEHYLTKSQERIAKELLYQWYEPVLDKHLAKVHGVYVARIGIVQKYLNKDPRRRYVQLPDRYFDPQNPSGFTGTRIWYVKQKQQEKQVRLKLILHAQIRRFLNNEKKATTHQKPRLTLFKSCEQRLSKLGNPELLRTFHQSVLNQNTYQLLQS